MGERIEFPMVRTGSIRRGCTRWQQAGPASISLIARPACAALATALAGIGTR